LHNADDVGGVQRTYLVQASEFALIAGAPDYVDLMPVSVDGRTAKDESAFKCDDVRGNGKYAGADRPDKATGDRTCDKPPVEEQDGYFGQASCEYVRALDGHDNLRSLVGW
jgi:hypothetical protein